MQAKRMEEKNRSKDEIRNFLLTVLLGVVCLIWLFFKILVGIVLLLYSVSVMVMYLSPAARELLIYLHPLKNPFHNLSDPKSFGLHGTVSFFIPGPVGRLGAWHIPAQHVVQAEEYKGKQHFHLRNGSPIILYLHGNAYTRGARHRVGLYKVLSSLGYHVIAVDYRGFGDSEGTPSEAGLIEDGIAAWRWIKSESDEVAVYIWGHSLGSGVAGGVGKALCSDGSPPSGIILEAPFNNVQEGAAQHPMAIPFWFLPYFKETVLDELEEVFRTDKRLAAVDCPIMILHDRDDEIISFDLGKKLFKAAKDSRPSNAGAIEFVEFNGHHGHMFIYQSDRLPGIVFKMFDPFPQTLGDCTIGMNVERIEKILEN